ncbi:SCO3242 family prenyltransferase [Streptomyces albicerus]|uniref:SCO3242 family prenyltransferase n=1 Tax=Streptomyces albicerus TaxID=2569859 RepID=UPI00384F488D
MGTGSRTVGTIGQVGQVGTDSPVGTDSQALRAGGRALGTGRRTLGASTGPNPWVELLRLPALFTVPGDALAGAAAAGARPNPRTLLAIASSLCLYEAGMALNDWADRAEDAVDRPQRPLPSGRIKPPAALAAACGLTAAGLALASRAGRRPLAVAGALAATVWSYDLVLKRTPAGPVAMAAARALDLLLGTAATNGDIRDDIGGDIRRALPSALALGTHTLAVTTVSRHETQGGSPWAPLTALATTTALTWAVTRDDQARNQAGGPAARLGTRAVSSAPGPEAGLAAPTSGSEARISGSLSWGPAPRVPVARRLLASGRTATAPSATASNTTTPRPTALSATASGATAQGEAALRGALAVVYAVTCARPLFHAALNPSPPLTQRAVGGGIRAMIPLQAALAARSGAPVTALLTAALAPAARRFSRRVSLT